MAATELAKVLSERKKQRHMTTARLSELSGVPKGTINKLLTGETCNPTLTTLRALADALCCSVAELCGSPAAEEPVMRPVPMLGSIAAGIPIYASDDHEQIFCDSDMPCDFALRVSGSSMIGARICDGDVVFVRAQDDVEDGEIAAVLLDDSATLKRVYHIPNGVHLVSENPVIAPMDYTYGDVNTIRILGKAVGFRSKL